MLDTLVHRIVSPMAGVWLNSSRKSWEQLPTPTDGPVVHSPGADADQVLLVGSSVAMGYGVSSAELALGGHLAHQLTELTGRGATVETIASLGLRMVGCVAALESLDLSRFDALVIALGTAEAVNLLPVEEFRHELDDLLAWVDKHAPASLSVVFVGIPLVPTMMRVPWPVADVVGKRCAALDEQLKRSCAEHSGTTYVPFTPALPNALTDSGRSAYARWAGLLAPAISRVLDAQLSNPREPVVGDGGARQLALDELGILDTGADERFDRIVASARELFGVAGASITFMDRERQWTKASAGIDPTEGPLGGALGAATVDGGELLVVHDARHEARFRKHANVPGRPEVRFFAGFPIEAANGERIGALCLMDSKPRAFSPAEGTLLSQLATQVQVDLWGSGPAE